MSSRHFIASGLSVLLFALFPGSPHAEESQKALKRVLDTTAIKREIGKTGESKGDVYKISFPRTDLRVTVKGVRVKPGLALGSWMAFRPTGETTIVDGDLVLTEDEVDPACVSCSNTA